MSSVAQPAAGRISQLRQQLREQELDALVVTSATNIRYLTGFSGSNGTVVITASKAVLVTDRRYDERAADELAAAKDQSGVDIDVSIAPGAGHDAIALSLAGVSKVGMEAEHLSWDRAQRLQDLLGGERIRPTSGIVEALREFKTDAEIDVMRSAASIADQALSEVTSVGIAGKTERELQRLLDHTALNLGADGASFDTIVASGPLAARPHHEAGERVIEHGDLVIIDFGTEVAGYRSDMTRTFITGTPTDQQALMLEAVEQAQAAGVKAAGPGVATSAIDQACRTALATHGLADYFTHGTGHGVGLDIHEAPSVSATSTATLAPGHVITVEPGVYIPNVGGVRWEDTLVITSTGTEVLTKSPKQPHL